MTERGKKKILMIDNYDSFTYNLVHYLGELGQRIEVKRNDCLDFDFIDGLGPDMIVISPGPCTPREAGLSVDIIKRYAGKSLFWAFASDTSRWVCVRGQHSSGEKTSTR